jgi:spermidine synthase
MALYDRIVPLDSARLRAAPALFAVTLFSSALLLFAVQPMFAKMVLPILGGSPSVWSVAMVFFQGALLIGYGYAHLLARTLAPGQAALVHLAILGAAALTLPIGIAVGFGAPPSSGVALWLVALFAASIGLPFVALSASAPLLQSWFAASGHPQARNPYVLYAASNLGSFAALLLYPLAIESALPLRAQAWVWSAGFAALAVLVAFAATIAARGATRMVAAPVAGATKVTMRERLAWVALAAIPAGLVIAVTAYISTDVAAAPFLWVLPLALYLLTFVAVFRERPWFSHAIVVRLVPFLVAPLTITLLGGDREYWLATMSVNLLALFALALLCHGELYARRPAPSHLTEFYLWTSVGGVIGGIFAGLVAPLIFNRTYEYPILVVAALLVLPGALEPNVRKLVQRLWPALAAATAVLALAFLAGHLTGDAVIPFQIALVVLAGLMLLWRRDATRLAALAVVGFLATALWTPGVRVIETTRSFFGVHRVVETEGATHRILQHGTTIHGAEQIFAPDVARAGGAPVPLTYYYFGGPISESIAIARVARGELKNVAVVGLGAGSLACHAAPGENWTFFEIDPEVVRLASDPKLFHFLQKCPPAGIVLGDARLTLAASPKQYDLIVLDAFSSDAIPTHLLTREALRGYLAHLTPQGAIVMHISNRHMELAKVVAAIGAAEGLVTFVKADEKARAFLTDLHAAALVAMLARRESDLGRLPQTEGWRRTEAGDVAAWTDDYSDILGAIVRKKMGW